jgi:cytochrome c biogenesis protein CcmG, thiol:disulfide interchange protein DsbE
VMQRVNFCQSLKEGPGLFRALRPVSTIERSYAVKPPRVNKAKEAMFALLRVVVAFLLCSVLLSASSGQQFDPGTATIRFVKNPEPVPDFTVTDVDGNSITSRELRGKVVLLSFWATWCQPCLDEILDLIAIQTRYADRLRIIGLSLDYGPPESVNPLLKRVAQERGINYPVAVAPNDLQAKFGGILGLPTTFLLDEAGRLVQKHVGVVNPSLYETEIRALLNLPVAAKVEFSEDKGQVLAPHARMVKELPGVDLSKLAPQQKEAALRLLNERKCSCTCRMTLAQCRITDSICATSLKQAAELVSKISADSQSGQQARPSP